MATEGEARSPSEQLAATIATALHGAGLIGGEPVARVAAQLASGALGEAEWRALIEAGLPEPALEETHVARD